MCTQTHTLYSYIGPLPSGFLGCFVAVPPVSPPLVPSVMWPLPLLLPQFPSAVVLPLLPLPWQPPPHCLPQDPIFVSEEDMVDFLAPPVVHLCLLLSTSSPSIVILTTGHARGVLPVPRFPAPAPAAGALVAWRSNTANSGSVVGRLIAKRSSCRACPLALRSVAAGVIALSWSFQWVTPAVRET